jgi:uncharacterized membrane protein YoaK (UPF0700 family)
MLVVFVAIVGAAFFAMGAMLRRWYALLTPTLLWAALMLATAIDRGFGDSENRPETVILIWVLFVLVPVLVMTALGVVAGKAIERARVRRRRAARTERAA